VKFYCHTGTTFSFYPDLLKGPLLDPVGNLGLSENSSRVKYVGKRG